MAAPLRTLIWPLLAGAVAAAGCDSRPAPPAHRSVGGNLAGGLIAGTEVAVAPATTAPAVPEPPSTTTIPAPPSTAC